ncbi:MAG: ShlB/FhaC/HecB family hemolysin secretion/activation protein [Verrucomicrobia bacterium]|nr:ShlB/FhaC/HecB family hemolysin secretion/activation protein [Verrucomicrobiota bacterium]
MPRVVNKFLASKPLSRGWGLLLGIVLASSWAELRGQAAPDAGSLLNQIQRSFPAPRLPDVGPEAPPPKVEIVTPKGPTLTVKAFTFTGNLLIPSEQLAPLLAGYVGRPLTFEDLRNAAAEISLHYRRQGYVATVSVPKQEVTSGFVVLRVLESRFGGVSLDPASDGRISPELLKQIITHAMIPGAPTDMRLLDRGLLLAGDLPGASVTGGLAAGTEEGRSDLVLLSRKMPLWSGSVSADNAGARSTGAPRALASVALASPQGLGEQFSADLLKSEGARFGRLGFGLPVGYEGSRLTFGVGRMDYELVSPDFVAARLAGQSTTWTADYLRPLARSRVFNVNFTAGLESKAFRNTAADVSVSDYAIRSVAAGFNANVYDGFLGGGVTSANLQWTAGELDLGGSPNQASVASTTKAEGRFQKLRLTLTRSQNLAEGLVLAASFNGQLASKNLDSAEKLFAGGVGGVRAYPVNEGSGDEGYVAALETRWQFATRWQAIAFVDHARMRVNADNAINGAAAVNHLSYEGAGLGLSWAGPADTVWRATWSRRLGDNPNPKPDGSDQDGTLRHDRLWLSVSLNY